MTTPKELILDTLWEARRHCNLETPKGRERNEQLEAAIAWIEQRTPQQKAEQVTYDSYVQPVPDHCDRIIWRGQYFHLPLAAQPLDPEGVRLLQGAKRNHRYFDTGGDVTSCPAADGLGPCDCGADEWNAQIDAYLAKHPEVESVRMPTSKEHAELMIRLGSMWLEQNYAAGG